MAGLLAAERPASADELGHHVAIAHRRGGHLDSSGRHRAVEAVVGHHGHGHAPAGQSPGGAQVQRGEGDQLVAVHHGACAVHRKHAVAVAVEREAHVVAAGRHGLCEMLDMGGAAALVDVAAVRLGGHRLHIRAQAAEDLRRHAVGGPMGAVEQHAQPRQVERLEARLELAQVVGPRPVQLAHAAGRGG